MKKSKYFEKLANYAKKIFGVALRDVWITKRRDNDGSGYFSLEITVDMPLNILRKYKPQLKEYYDMEVKNHNLDIHTCIKAYRNFGAKEIRERGKSKCLYQRNEIFEINA